MEVENVIGECTNIIVNDMNSRCSAPRQSCERPTCGLPSPHTKRLIDRIKSRIERKRWFFSLEFFPPRTSNGAANLYQKIERLAREKPLFCDVTWHPAGDPGSLTKATSSMVIGGTMVNYCGVETMLHITCLGYNRDQILQYLHCAKELGIRNLLALRGDKPAKPNQTNKSTEGQMNGHSQTHGTDSNELPYATDLVRLIRAEFGTYFCIGVAGYPSGHPEASSYEADLANLKAKVDAGADFIITQLFFRAVDFERFVADCRRVGIKVPIVPGLMPIQAYASLRHVVALSKLDVPQEIVRAVEAVRDNDEAIRAFGVELGTRTCLELLAGGACGVHFYTLNREAAVLAILQRMRDATHSGLLSSAKLRLFADDANGHQHHSDSDGAEHQHSYSNAIGHYHTDSNRIEHHPSNANGVENHSGSNGGTHHHSDLNGVGHHHSGSNGVHHHGSPKKSSSSYGHWDGCSYGDQGNRTRRWLPWKQSGRQSRKLTEYVRPIYWSVRPNSYLYRTSHWEEFPNGRWGNSSAASFGDLRDYHLFYLSSLNALNRDQLREQLLAAPCTVADLASVFCCYLSREPNANGVHVDSLPWSDSYGEHLAGLSSETSLILPELIAANRLGYFTINSQPSIDGVPSHDPIFGWGPPRGYVYQKAYLEFFCSRRRAIILHYLLDGPQRTAADGSLLFDSHHQFTLDPADGCVLVDGRRWTCVNSVPEKPEQQDYRVNYQITDASGKTEWRNCADEQPAAVTWGVFPGREVIQPTVVDSAAFRIWAREAFDLWLTYWAALYSPESTSFHLLKRVHDSFCLVNVVDNDFKKPNCLFELLRVVAQIDDSLGPDSDLGQFDPRNHSHQNGSTSTADA